MANQMSTVGSEELVIKTGGNGSNGGNGDSVVAEPTTSERIAFAQGQKLPSPEMMERYESLLDAYTQKFEERIKQNIRAASIGSGNGANEGLELGEVITQNPVVGFYKWWDLFLVGPIQLIPPAARPNRILASGEPVFFIAFVVTNPLFIDGINPPSAQTVLAGQPYTLRLDTVNLRTVTPGPSVVIASAFPGGAAVQAFLLGFVVPPINQGEPEVLEVNLTADALNAFQPFAAFATSILDIDVDPGFPVGPAIGPHVLVEQPLRCLCYRRV